MDPAALKDAISRKPFRPFNLHYPSGNTYAIRSEDQAIVTARSIVIAKGPERGGRGFDMLDIIMIERLEVLDEDPAPPKWWWMDDDPFPRGNGFNGG